MASTLSTGHRAIIRQVSATLAELAEASSSATHYAALKHSQLRLDSITDPPQPASAAPSSTAPAQTTVTAAPAAAPKPARTPAQKSASAKQANRTRAANKTAPSTTDEKIGADTKAPDAGTLTITEA